MGEPIDPAERPSRTPWPPILLGLCLLGAILVERVVPLPTGIESRAAGLGLIILAFSIDAWVFEVFRRHRTEILPHKAATSLVTEGPFRFSRNPIYVGNALLILAGLFLTGSAWFLLGAVIFVLAVTPLAIQREERHLAAKFGPEWDEYAARVRRWI